MVAYINIQMTEYLATNYSLFDLAIVTIVIVSILILGLVYFSGSKKKTECTASLSVEEEKSDAARKGIAIVRVLKYHICGNE